MKSIEIMDLIAANVYLSKNYDYGAINNRLNYKNEFF